MRDSKIIFVLICFILCGCELGDIPPDEQVVYMEAGESVPFAGTLLSDERYDYLLRCEGYILREGIELEFPHLPLYVVAR